MCQTFFSKPFTNLLNVQKQYEKNVWEKTNDTVILIVDKSTDHDKPHFDSFYITISMLKKLFLSEHKLKKALHDTLTRAAFYGLLLTMAN